jgi:DNA-binding IclR family transcriptional regulator
MFPVATMALPGTPFARLRHILLHCALRANMQSTPGKRIPMKANASGRGVMSFQPLDERV